MAQMMKLVSVETAAGEPIETSRVTQEVFDGYSAAKKRKYLAEHPTSKFGKAKPAKDKRKQSDKAKDMTPAQLKKEILKSPNSHNNRLVHLKELNSRGKKKYTLKSLQEEDSDNYSKGKRSVNKYGNRPEDYRKYLKDHEETVAKLQQREKDNGGKLSDWDQRALAHSQKQIEAIKEKLKKK